MRINKFIAQATGIGRRPADALINEGRVTINSVTAQSGDNVDENDVVFLDNKRLSLGNTQTIMLNKPVGFVVSRSGQGSQTIYDLLPAELHNLKPIGRLDKNSSGLLLLTNNGDLANELTHPSKQKRKVYEISLSKPLQPLHRQYINDTGITLEDGISKLGLERLNEGDDTGWLVSMHEGRNRQIRRTFKALGYEVTRLHRIEFGSYKLDNLNSGSWQKV